MIKISEKAYNAIMIGASGIFAAATIAALWMIVN